MHPQSTRREFGERRCAVCQRAFSRRAGEQGSHFRKRQTCGRACARVLIEGTMRAAKQQRAKAREQAVPLRLCRACREPLVRKRAESLTRFRERVVCDVRCRNRAQAEIDKRRRYGDPDQARHCVICGTRLVRRPNQSLANFFTIKVCGLSCAGTHSSRRQLQEASLRRDGYGVTFTLKTREQIRHRDGHRCRLCAAPRGKRALAVHHIDYDKRNGDERNLITLCGRCHAWTNYDRDYWRALFTDTMTTEAL